VRACPYGDDAHFDTIEEATVAAMVQTTKQEEDSESEAYGHWLHFLKRAQSSGRTVKVSPAHRAVLFTGFLLSLAKDFTARGIKYFLRDDDKDMSSLRSNEWEAFKRAQAQPIRLTPADEQQIAQVEEETGFTREEIEAYADGNVIVSPVWRGEQFYFHPTRHVAAAAMGQGIAHGYRVLAAEYKKDSEAAAAELIAQLQEQASAEQESDKIEGAPLADMPVQKDPRHRYGATAPKVEVSSEPGEPKPLDPAFLEALRKMYIAKFGKEPEQDGVDTGALIAMFNKGELD